MCACPSSDPPLRWRTVRQPAVLFDFTLFPSASPFSSLAPVFPLSRPTPPLSFLLYFHLLCPPLPFTVLSHFPQHPHPLPHSACEVLFVRTDSRLALNIHGDCQPVANTKAARRAPVESKPGLGSRSEGGGGLSPSPVGPRPPLTHTHTYRLETGEEVKKTSTHRCSSMQMCMSVRLYAHTHTHNNPLLNLPLAYICRPQGRRVTYTLSPPVYPPLLSLAPSHPDAHRIGNVDLLRRPCLSEDTHARKSERVLSVIYKKQTNIQRQAAILSQPDGL